MKKIYLYISNNSHKPFFRWLKVKIRMVLYALENKNNDHHTNGEFWLMSQLTKLVPQVVFDVGANEGKWSQEALLCFPKAHLYSFEPVPSTFVRLSNFSQKLERISIYPLALSNKPDRIKFHVYDNTSLFSSMYSHPSGRGGYDVEVDAIDGDSFCDEIVPIQEIDFLKIDVEGAEHLVLAGFEKMLRLQKIRCIQFEYGIVSVNTKFLLKDYFDIFTRFDYRIGKLYPSRVDFHDWTSERENFIGPNYVAIRKSDSELLGLLSS